MQNIPSSQSFDSETKMSIINQIVENPNLLSSKYGIDLSLDNERSVLLEEYLNSVDSLTERHEIIKSIIDVKLAPRQSLDDNSDPGGPGGVVLNTAVFVNVVAYVNVVVAANALAQAIAVVQAGVWTPTPPDDGINQASSSMNHPMSLSFFESELSKELSSRRLSKARQVALINHAISAYGNLKEGLQTISYKYKNRDLRLDIYNKRGTLEVIGGSIH